jgi:hypothetical protein
VATVSPDWETTPDNTSVYKILPVGRSVPETLGTQAQADIRTSVGLASANLDTQIAAVKTDTGNLITRIPAALFSGITSLANWLRLMCRSDSAIGTDAATELAEINNDEGSGAGDYDQTNDSLEALEADSTPRNVRVDIKTTTVE